jgi:hypothetical protein
VVPAWLANSVGRASGAHDFKGTIIELLGGPGFALGRRRRLHDDLGRQLLGHVDRDLCRRNVDLRHFDFRHLYVYLRIAENVDSGQLMRSRLPKSDWSSLLALLPDLARLTDEA